MRILRVRSWSILLIVSYFGVLAASAGAPQAEEDATSGPIPINGPVVISTSGYYVVTADFVANGIPAIKLAGSVNASIDFAGHTVSAVGAPVVLAHSVVDDGGCRTLSMRNGRINGGFGVSSKSNGLDCVAQVQLDRMTVTATDVYVENGGLIVTSSTIMNGGIIVRTALGGPPARIEGNRVLFGDITLLGNVGGSIIRNVVRGAIFVRGTNGHDASSILIASNIQTGPGGIEIGGFSAEMRTDHVQLLKNKIGGAVSLIQAHDSTVELNVIGGCTPSGSSVGVDGERNRVASNTFNGGCDHGIEFSAASQDNGYGYNTFRVYVPVPVLDLGTNNVDLATRDVAEEEGVSETP
jgi:hypothetical protein